VLIKRADHLTEVCAPLVVVAAFLLKDSVRLQLDDLVDAFPIEFKFLFAGHIKRVKLVVHDLRVLFHELVHLLDPVIRLVVVNVPEQLFLIERALLAFLLKVRVDDASLKTASQVLGVPCG